MRQRVVIAMALALEPSLVIMDEPTTALDVVVQNGIIKKVMELQQKFGFSVLFITHDLPLMLEMCDRIGVMYAGKLVEVAGRGELLKGAQHPYTQGLLGAFPALTGPKIKLEGIPGSPPDLISPPPGCRFAPRCKHAMPQCHTAEPAGQTGRSKYVACHLYTEGEIAHEQVSAGSERAQ
ncbi:oligopeptide/dipeptide ABC transporter ATP-binding protein [Gordoniibacillus kamchatkensis]|uniref:oligopeptide/dipeptide ABC transporter ATP-binding protein n=1 Tax=Gordoniibacillus kamchatkensis TaxID=1590651 RepID=UPI000ABB42D0